MEFSASPGHSLSGQRVYVQHWNTTGLNGYHISGMYGAEYSGYGTICAVDVRFSNTGVLIELDDPVTAVWHRQGHSGHEQPSQVVGCIVDAVKVIP